MYAFVVVGGAATLALFSDGLFDPLAEDGLIFCYETYVGEAFLHHHSWNDSFFVDGSSFFNGIEGDGVPATVFEAFLECERTLKFKVEGVVCADADVFVFFYYFAADV